MPDEGESVRRGRGVRGAVVRRGTERGKERGTTDLPVQWMRLQFFRWIARRRLRRNFRALRLAHAERLPRAEGAGSAGTGRLVFYLNHPSWWDPLVCLVLAPIFIPGRNFFAPMDAASLERYKFMARLGMFPVEMATARGAGQFLRSAEAVLARGDVLGVTPQGAFTDARTRPVVFRAGLGALVSRLERAGLEVTVVPIALEYVFWNQRLPEALVNVGEPFAVGGRASGEGRRLGHAGWTAQLEKRMTVTQDELAALSARRDGGCFRTLLEGRRGTSGVYGAWQWVRRRWLGERGGADHLAHEGTGEGRDTAKRLPAE